MTSIERFTLMTTLVAISVSGGNVLAAEASDAAIDGCRDAVERERRARGGPIRVVDSEFSQANSMVTLEANGQVWRCIVSDRGEVWELTSERGYGSTRGQGRDDDDRYDDDRYDDDRYDDGRYDDRYGDDDRYDESRGAGVTLYRDTEFRGGSITLHQSESYLGDTRIGNDELSSIRVPSGCRVRLFTDANFRGRSVELSRDEPQLGRTPIGNDEASSIEVDCGGYSGGYRGGDDRYVDEVTLYKDTEFRGTQYTVREDVPYLGRTPIGNDELSSIRVPRGCRVRVYADADFRGRSAELSNDESQLSRTPIGNDEASSIEVECR